MSTIDTSLPADAVMRRDTNLVTHTRAVAKAFGKEHRKVMRRIESLDCSDQFLSDHFWPVQFEHNGNTYRAYEMDKDGFVFLVMGFTGKTAAEIKEAYINAFNDMARQLEQQKAAALPTRPETLTPAQQRHIQKRVAELAQHPGSSFAAVWRSVKDRFQVATYKDIPADQYPELCRFLGTRPEGISQALATTPARQRMPMLPRPELSDHHNSRDGRILVNELRRYLPSEAQPLADDLDRVIVQGWTTVDETLMRVKTMESMLTRWRG